MTGNVGTDLTVEQGTVMVVAVPPAVIGTENTNENTSKKERQQG